MNSQYIYMLGEHCYLLNQNQNELFSTLTLLYWHCFPVSWLLKIVNVLLSSFPSCKLCLCSAMQVVLELLRTAVLSGAWQSTSSTGQAQGGICRGKPGNFPPHCIWPSLPLVCLKMERGRERGKGRVGETSCLTSPTGFCLKYHPGLAAPEIFD